MLAKLLPYSIDVSLMPNMKLDGEHEDF